MKINDSKKLLRYASVGLYSRYKKIVLLLLVALFMVTFFQACSQIRKVTYPRDYVYLEQKEIDSKMAILGFYVRQLDEILASEDDISADDQRRILGILSSMNTTVDSLNVSNKMTNHFVIDDHMGQFKSEVLNAIDAAKTTPPNYFLVGKISGSCVACHRFRKF
ncbi:MAG: hypothetical protein ACI9KN_001559 [Gammaproteobacteria bacterium]|jgi:hypothetical protein